MRTVNGRSLPVLVLGALAALCARPAAAKESPKKASAGASVQWVKLPAGTFEMGSDQWAETRPVHKVAMKAFELAKTPVTAKQYRACVAAGACTPITACAGAAPADDEPVTCVDWRQASAFAKWVGGRLPSDAEWEYAARSAGESAKYPWGAARPKLRPVCANAKAKTKQGVCDMPGVWEWVADWYHTSYLGTPKDGSAWADAGWDRVYVGGPFFYYEKGKMISPCRRLAPETHRADLGFRVARS